MQHPNSSAAPLRHKILWLSIGTTLAATAVLCAFAFVTLRDALHGAAVDQLSAEVGLYEQKVASSFEGLLKDAEFLANTPDMVDALDLLAGSGGSRPDARIKLARARLARTLSLFMKSRPHLVTARLVGRDDAVRELVRVETVGSATEIAVESALEEMAAEPYMMASSLLWPGDWHWSAVRMDVRQEAASPATLHVVYAIAGGDGHTGGFVVLTADYAMLMRRAVGVLPQGTRLDLSIGAGDHLVFSEDTPEGELEISDAGVTFGTGGRIADAVAVGENVIAGRTRPLGGGKILSINLSKPHEILMQGTSGRLFSLLLLSGCLLALASLVAVLLGNRLASHLSRLADMVSEPGAHQTRLTLESGGFREVDVLAKAFCDVLGTLRDQSEELAWRATHDQLSGLLNRSGAEEAIAERIDPHGRATVIQFDLDRFKLVNDTLGHAAGDAVIAAVGLRLRAQCEPGDVMARIGGDEFVVIRPGSDYRALEAFARQALPKLSAPVRFGDRICRFGVSMGAADGPASLLLNGEMLRRADHALYQAKNAGRGRFVFFSPDMERRLRDRALIATDLETAIENEEFVVEYMPKVAAADRRLVGFEALVRWQHPTRGMLMPMSFLPIAEEMKLTAAIDDYVLRRVLRDREVWRTLFDEVPPVSVNVSARRLLDPALVETVTALRIPPGAISFELLESIFLDNASDLLTWSCDALRDMGIAIEIDDFGSGHASMLGITRVRPDRIKIDRALVREIVGPESDTAMVRAILDMANAFRIDTIAEGVETDAQARVLANLGCDALQGYLFGMSAPAEDVPRLIRGNPGYSARRASA